MKRSLMLPAVAIIYSALCVYLLVVITPVMSHGKGYSDRNAQSVTVGNKPVLIVENSVGDVTLKTSPAGSMWIESERYAQTASTLAAFRTAMTSEGGVVHVMSGASERASGGIRLTISAPANTQIQVNSRVGRVSATGFTGPVALHTGVGAIQVQDATGVLQLESGIGEIRVSGGSNGLHATTNVGSISIDGRLTGENVVQTGTGSIRVAVPGSNSLSVEADAHIGSVSNDFGFPVMRNSGMSQAIRGNIGSGGRNSGTLKLHSRIGSISLARS